VPKILVADDNSNIQKMVGLALKDQGIDVVAVGNGEAAVRKISDIKPDLVLADVFMPVRNGYEVCQYVKSDPNLSHIPVILLVGAFDPLDEQEAQRVGADGVLKKPFVPPDPLISMVKSALARAGVALATANNEKAAEAEAAKAASLLESRPSAIPTVTSMPAQQEEPIAALNDEGFVDEAPLRPEPVKFETGSQTVAFGSLLETPADDTSEDDPAFMPPKHSELAERDWNGHEAEEEDEEEEEEKPTAAWRREDAEAYADAKPGGGGNDWRSGGFEQILAKKTQVDSWEPQEEKQVVSKPAETTPAVAANVTEAPATPAAPFAGEAWAGAISAAGGEKTVAEKVTALEEVVRTVSSEHTPVETAVASVPEIAKSEPEKKSVGDSWFSAAPSPWDAEVQKATQLASTWDVPATPASPAASSNGSAPGSHTEAVEAVIEQAALPATTVEAIREEAAQVAVDATQTFEQVNADGTPFYAHEEIIESAAPTPAATPSMDELVAKVLAKMSPEVLQAVTREILKPVVEAMVKEEMNSKKP
jgi:CheY-like chemotaxis protein